MSKRLKSSTMDRRLAAERLTRAAALFAKPETDPLPGPDDDGDIAEEAVAETPPPVAGRIVSHPIRHRQHVRQPAVAVAMS